MRGHSGALSIRPFRRLWVATSLSSLGDWLSLLALTALAGELTEHHGFVQENAAVGAVWLTSLLPALVLGPLAGAFADRFDRRLNMIVGDVVRAVLYLTIPLNLRLHLVDELSWMYIVQFLASSASLFWTPAKDASVPNLVPPERLEEANQLSLLTTYGTAPVAGLLFAVLALVTTALGSISPYFATNPVNLALYFNAGTFIVSAITIFMLREIRRARGQISTPSVAKAIWEGWQFLGRNQVVRGIVIGMVGAFAAGGVVVGLGPAYVRNTLHGGNAGWGVVFSAIFFGLAAGMFLGMRIMRGFSRRRLFGVAITSAAVPLALIGLIPNLVVAIVLVLLLGACAGIAYVTGYTIIGLEVDDNTRGRTFAFLQSAIRVILFAVIAIAPSLAAGITAAGPWRHGRRFRPDQPSRLWRHRRQHRAAAGRRGGGRAGRRLLPADGRSPRRAAGRRSVLGVPRRGVPAGAGACRTGARPRPRPRPGSSAGCCSRWRAVRARASPPRPGCSRSGCGTRDSTSSPRTSRARPRSACGCAHSCSTPRTPGSPGTPRR